MLAMISRDIPHRNHCMDTSGSISSHASTANIQWWTLPTDPQHATTAMMRLASESQPTELSTSVQTVSS